MIQVVKLKSKFMLSPIWRMISYFMVLLTETFYFVVLVLGVRWGWDRRVGDVSKIFSIELHYITLISLKVSALAM